MRGRRPRPITRVVTRLRVASGGVGQGVCESCLGGSLGAWSEGLHKEGPWSRAFKIFIHHSLALPRSIGPRTGPRSRRGSSSPRARRDRRQSGRSASGPISIPHQPPSSAAACDAPVCGNGRNPWHGRRTSPPARTRSGWDLGLTIVLEIKCTVGGNIRNVLLNGPRSARRRTYRIFLHSRSHYQCSFSIRRRDAPLNRRHTRETDAETQRCAPRPPPGSKGLPRHPLLEHGERERGLVARHFVPGALNRREREIRQRRP